MRQRIGRHYANVVATVALVVALTTGGAYAVDKIGGDQIKPRAIGAKHIKRGAIQARHIRRNSVRSAQLSRNAVKTASIAPDAVTSDEIGDGEVVPDDLTLPAPVELRAAAGSFAPGSVGTAYSLVADVGRFVKVDQGSALHITWTGSARSGNTGCIFQIRLDDGSVGGGEFYVEPGSKTVAASATALFKGVSAGEHRIQVWARAPEGDPGLGMSEPHHCTVAPVQATVPNSFVAAEQV